MENERNTILVLGVGNILMNDEGVGIRVVQLLENEGIPGADLIDGGTGGFHLLGFIQSYRHVIFIDASLDDHPPGPIRIIHPKFARDFPQQLSAHEIGLKDLIESCSLMGNIPEFHLVAVSVRNFQDLGLTLTPEIAAIVPRAAEEVRKLIASFRE